MTKITEDRLREELHDIAAWTGEISVPDVPTELQPMSMSAPPAARHAVRVLIAAAALAALLAAVVALRPDAARPVDPEIEAASRIRAGARALAAGGPTRVTVLSTGVPRWDSASLGGSSVTGSYDVAARTGTLVDGSVPGFTEYRLVTGEMFVWIPAWEQRSLDEGSWVRISPDDLRAASSDVRSVTARFLLRDPGAVVALLSATSRATPRGGWADGMRTYDATIDVTRLHGTARLLSELVGQRLSAEGEEIRHTVSVTLDGAGDIRIVDLFFQRTPLGYTALLEGDNAKMLFDQVGVVAPAEAERPPQSETVSELLARRPFLQSDHTARAATGERSD